MFWQRYMFIYIIVISKQNRQTDKPTDGFLLLTGTLNHTIPKKIGAFITSVHLRLYQSDVTVTTSKVDAEDDLWQRSEASGAA